MLIRTKSNGFFFLVLSMVMYKKYYLPSASHYLFTCNGVKQHSPCTSEGQTEYSQCRGSVRIQRGHYQYEPSKRPEKGKGPTKRLNVSDKKKRSCSCAQEKVISRHLPISNLFMLLEMLKRISTQGSTEEPEACTSAITTQKVEDIFPFSDDLDYMDQNYLFFYRQ